MTVPADLKYTKDHEWARVEGDVVTIGISDHAQTELGDITFVELPAIGKTVKGLRDNMSDDSDKPDEQTKADPDKAVSSADPAKDDADSKSDS